MPRNRSRIATTWQSELTSPFSMHGQSDSSTSTPDAQLKKYIPGVGRISGAQAYQLSRAICLQAKKNGRAADFVNANFW